MNISFAKLGYEECEVCIKYDEHSSLSDSIETKCACCSSVNQQKKGKNECICCRKSSEAKKKKRSQRKKNTECSKISAEAFCKCCKVHNEMAQLKSIEAAGCDDCAKYAEHVLHRKNKSRQCNEQDKMLSEKSTDGKTCFYSLDLQKVRMLPEMAGVKTCRIYATNMCIQ